MNNSILLDCIGYIDDQMIEKAANYVIDPPKASPPVRRSIRAAVAACLLLIFLGAFAALNASRQSGSGSTGVQPPEARQILVARDTAEAGQSDDTIVQVVTPQQGALVSAGQSQAGGEISGEISVYVAPEDDRSGSSDTMSIEEAKEYAYLDYASASAEMKEKILEARNVIIFSSDWVADGYSGSIQNVETGEVIRELPVFSELFPGWDMPVAGTARITGDGLGADCLYGLSLEIVQIDTEGIICRAAESANMFTEGQYITVFLPDDQAPESLGLQAGDVIFAAYYGSGCSVAESTIHALSITK